MPALQGPPTTPGDLALRVIGLLNLYRLLIPIALLAINWATSPAPNVGAAIPSLFTSICALYLAAGALLVAAQRFARFGLRTIALTHALVDSAGIGLLLLSSGGVASNLGILLVLPVGATALLATSRDAFFIAATAGLSVLLQQLACQALGFAQASDYTTAGVLGSVLFLIALGAWPVANRLRESEALVKRQEIDLANAAQLSQYIVQHLRESILVVDPQDRIRLINEAAAELLGDDHAYPGALLGEANPRLLYLLATWRGREGPDADNGATFVAADGARVIRPYFAPLGSDDPAPVLVFLEDTSALASKVQQSKLAALGRLSASIAHEIRNPVGAMSHAGQLLAESPALPEADRRLTEIITRNAERVSTIINNVLSMSRRDAVKPERVRLHEWLQQFREEFCSTTQWPLERLTLTAAEGERDHATEVRVDPSQLRQVITNLCDNALKYGRGSDPTAPIELRYGRLKPSARPYLEVADRGPGIAPEHAERIFEPFFSGEQRSSGLGLFLARELAQTNAATLLYEARPGGGSIFRLVFSDPARWET